MTIELHSTLNVDVLTSVQTVIEPRQLRFLHSVVAVDDDFNALPLSISYTDPRLECWPVEMCSIYDYNYIDGSYSVCDGDLLEMTNNEILEILKDSNKALGIHIVDEDFNGYLMSRPTTFFNN